MAVVATSSGWTAQYFDANGAGGLGGVNFAAAPIASATLSEIQEFAFDAGFADGRAPGDQPNDDYAASYSGTFTLDSADPVTFALRASGVAQLWIDGNLVATAQGFDTVITFGPCASTGKPVCLCAGDKTAAAQQVTATLDLAAGLHTVEVRFLDSRGSINDQLNLDWSVGADAGFTSMQLGAGDAPSVDIEGDGEWTGVFNWPLLALHAMITPDGKVLTYGTDEAGVQGGEEIYSVWDPETGEYYVLENTTQTDLFCSFPIIVPETGEVLIAGGDTRGLGVGPVNNGVNDVNVYDYETMTVGASATGDMEFARWYPTIMTLPSGQLLILGGRDFDGTYVGTPEIYTPGEGWRTLTGATIPEFDVISDYPRAWTTSDGRIIVFAAQGGRGATSVFEVDVTGSGSFIDTGLDVPVQLDWYMPAVMYDIDKALLIAEDGSAWILDMSGGGLAFTRTADVGPNRVWSDMLVLPDGRVMVAGGSATETSASGTYALETNTTVTMWDPETGLWTEMADEHNGRYYHSTTILLPDGSILSAGGGAPGPLNNTNAEIYLPDYLFDEDGELAERLVISDMPEGPLEIGETFRFTVSDAAAVTEVAITAFSSVTHSFNATSRRAELEFVQIDATTIEVTLPATGGALPPGYWHLWALDANGTPSEGATFVVAPSEAYYMPVEYPLGLDIVFNGDAEFNPATNELVLTPDLADQMGTATLGERFDFSKDFFLSFDMYLGVNDFGADGFAVTFHNDARGPGSVGNADSPGAFGAYYQQFGLAIGFDTFDNGAANGDIPNDHVTVFDTETLEELVGPIDVGNVEDGVWRTVDITWDASTTTLAFSIDGVTIGTLETDLADDHFNGSDFGYVSFSAATGGASNLMKVRLNEIDATYASGERIVAEEASQTVDFFDNLDQHFVFSGSAVHQTRFGIFTLTPDEVYQTGGAMSAKRVDYAFDFEVAFEMGFDVDGADGMAFVIHNDPDGPGDLGAGAGDFGARYLTNGVAIEFDTFFNEGRDADIADDHTNVFDTDGAIFTPGPTPEDPPIVDIDAARITDPTSLGEIEDGATRTVIVTWDASAQTLRYSVDGVVIATLPMDLTADYLGGSRYGYFGWTAATGGLAHEAGVTLRAIQATFEDGTSVDDADEGYGGGNAAPIAQDYAATIGEGAGAANLTAAILAGVTDGDLDPITIASVDTAGALGLVTLVGGQLTYAPNGAFDALEDGETATDVFTVTVTDGQGGQDTLTVTMTIAGASDDAGGGDDDVPAPTISGTEAGELIRGTAGADVIVGLGGADVIYAAGGDDIVLGGEGADEIRGNGGADDLRGGGGDDVIYGNGEDDVLRGDAGDDALYGGAGDDVFVFGPGSDLDVIKDFNAAAEVVRLVGSGFASTAAVVAALTQTAAGVELDLGGGDVLLLEGEALADLSAANFELVAGGGGSGGGGNTAPVAGDIAVTVDEDTASGNLAPAILAAASDVDPGAVLSIAAVDGAGAAGLVSLVGGVLTYDPNGAFEGLDAGETATDSFTVTIADGQGGVDTATVTVTVTGVTDATGGGNTPPVAGDIVVTVDEDTPSANLAPAILAAASDVDPGAALAIVGIDAAGAAGSALLVGGQVVYDPNGAFEALDAGETATDSFTVTIADGQGGFDTAVVTVTVTGVTDEAGGGGGETPAPTISGTAAGELIRGTAGADVIAALGGADQVFAGDGDDIVLGGEGADELKGNAGADDLRGEGGDDTLYGNSGDDTLWGGAGVDALFGGADVDTFVFGVGDGADTVKDFNATGGEVVRLVGTGFASAAAALAAMTQTAAGVRLDLGGGDVLLLEGEALGDLTAANIEIAAATGGGGTGGGGTGGATNTPPVAGDVGAATDEDTPTGDLAGLVLAAASDVDAGDTLSIASIDATGAAGLVSLVGGVLTYDPNGAFEALAAGATATDSFTVTLTDGKGGFDTATVTMTIAGVDEATGGGGGTGGGGTGGEGGLGETPPPTLVGTGAGELLRGGAGVDVIDAGGGADEVFGADGDDVILGGEGADVLKGNGGNDELRGGAGADSLKGDGGDDVLWGGADADLLQGGAGADTFVFMPGDGFDTVLDFGAGDDVVLLIGTGFGDAAAAYAAAVETARGLELDLGGGDLLLLAGEDKTTVGVDDFQIL